MESESYYTVEGDIVYIRVRSPHGSVHSDLERRDLAAPLPSRADAPAPPRRPRSKEDLFFEPQPMVRWMRPKVLIGAAKEVALSALFAHFADKREQQAGFPARWWDASGRAEKGSLWFDFASDTGDGFGPTYAVASQLARDRLTVEGEDLPRGKLLVLGGDQVYPSAGWDAYRNRFVGPYTAALPYVAAPKQPYLFALPGNHDWYDGLTSFMRLFCQRGWIGGWKTEQTRSYFAIKLPEPWWLWAVDTQFDTYIDGPQLCYFRELAKKLRKNDKVILVTAKPSWVEVRRRDETPQSWQTLAMLEQLIRGEGARLELTLTGDRHHYARYQGTGTQGTANKVTAGGAGAYVSATHSLPGDLHLPDHLELSRDRRGGTDKWTMERVYPSARESRKVRNGPVAWSLLRYAPGFAVVTAVLYAAVAASAALVVVAPTLPGLSLAALVTVLLGLGLGAFASKGAEGCTRARWRVLRLPFVLVHLGMHVAPPALLAVLLERTLQLSGGSLFGWAAAAGALAGFLLGPVTVASYLGFANWVDACWHANDIFAAQSQTAGRKYKHFLRMRVDEGGGVGVFAVAVTGAGSASDKRLRIAGPGGGLSAPWLRPPEGIGAVLIESFVAGGDEPSVQSSWSTTRGGDHAVT